MIKRRRLVVGLAGVGLGSALAATSAIADVTVSGKADALELTATQSTVKEALQRLSAGYGLELHGVDDLNEPLSGTYKGTLSSVVDQLLSTRSHIMRPKDNGLALFVLAAKPAAPVAPVAEANQAVAGDPVRMQLEKTITLSPQGQEMAVKMFGEKGRYLQIDETLLQSFFTGRGGRRFKQPPQ